jgi:hypothetical protein
MKRIGENQSIPIYLRGSLFNYFASYDSILSLEIASSKTNKSHWTISIKEIEWKKIELKYCLYKDLIDFRIF